MISPRSRDETPDLFTVEEAAQVLRIGRTAAYQLAQRDLATDGAEGLHVVRVGRLLRVPRAALEALVGGPIVLPGPPTPGAVVAEAAPSTPEKSTTATGANGNKVEPIAAHHTRSSREQAATTKKRRSGQLTLPFAS